MKTNSGTCLSLPSLHGGETGLRPEDHAGQAAVLVPDDPMSGQVHEAVTIEEQGFEDLLGSGAIEIARSTYWLPAKALATVRASAWARQFHQPGLGVSDDEDAVAGHRRHLSPTIGGRKLAHQFDARRQRVVLILVAHQFPGIGGSSRIDRHHQGARFEGFLHSVWNHEFKQGTRQARLILGGAGN